jgi:hypothetical protein
MNVLQARLILSSGFFIGGLLILSVHTLAPAGSGVQEEQYASYERYRTMYYLFYAFFLIIASIVLLDATN